MNKKLLLVAVAPMMLTSCGAKMSTDKAVKYAEDHFAAVTEVKDATAKSKVSVKKATGIFEGAVKDEKEESATKVSPLSAEEVKALGEMEDIKLSKFLGKFYVKMVLNNKELHEEFNIPEAAEIKGSMYSEAVYDKNGYVVKEIANVNLSVSYSAMGISIEGVLKASSTCTYKY